MILKYANSEVQPGVCGRLSMLGL